MKWIVNGCAINALMIKESDIDELIKDGYFRIHPDAITKKDDEVANICGKVTWFKIDDDEIGKIAKSVGRVVIRKS